MTCHMIRAMSATASVAIAVAGRCWVSFAAVFLCVAPHPLCAADVASTGDGLEQTPVVRLIDSDGKAVQGAHVGGLAFFGYNATEPKDDRGWHYRPHAVSDSDGIARLPVDRESVNTLVAYHTGRKLVAIQAVSAQQWKGGLTVILQPGCRVLVRMASSELESRHRKIAKGIVDLYLDGTHHAMSYCSEQSQFHFDVPPGTYRLRAYSGETYDANKTFTVQPGARELRIAPLEMHPQRWVVLQGQAAPDLQGIVAWKNSRAIRLSDLRGRVVLLEFWAHWCDSCLKRMAQLFSVYDKYHGRGLVIIGIHLDVGQEVDSIAELDRKLAQARKSLWKDRDIPFPVALVSEHRVPFRPDVERTACCPLAAEYGVDTVPTGMLLDRQGRLVGRWDVDSKQDLSLLEKMLGGD